MKAVPLSEVCRIVNGGTPKSGVADYWEGDVAWLTPAEMGKRKSPSIGQTARTITQAGLKNSSARQVPVGAVIMSTRAPIGHLAIPEVPMAFNQGCRGLVPNERLNTKYLYYFLFFSREALNELGTGATFKELASSALGKFHIPLPSLEEQRRIVAMLDEAFAAIATATANAEKNLSNAEELFDDFLSTTFDGTTNAWDVSTIGEVCTLRSGTTVKAELEQPSGEVPYLKVADMSHPDNLDAVTTSSRFLRRSDVGRNALIPAGATIFPKRGGAIMTNKKRLVATPMAADLNIMSVIPGPRLTARFLNYYFQNVDMRLLGSGSSIPQINNYDIEPLKIAIPDAATQLDFVAKADAVKSETMKLTAIYSRRLVQLSQLKQSLLHRAFTGELTAAMPETIAA